MGISDFDAMASFGKVLSVDTATVTIPVTDAAQLSRLQVNHLVVIRSSKIGQALIGMVNKIMRKYDDNAEEMVDGEAISSDIVKSYLNRNAS